VATTPTARPPADVSKTSKQLWRDLVADVECVSGGPPAAASLVIVEDVVRARERLVEIRVALAADGVTVSGSRGQKRPHPLLIIERQLVAEIATALDRLELRPSRIRGARLVAEARSLTVG
jgi:Phage terminase, small subunit